MGGEPYYKFLNGEKTDLSIMLRIFRELSEMMDKDEYDRFCIGFGRCIAPNLNRH